MIRKTEIEAALHEELKHDLTYKCPHGTIYKREFIDKKYVWKAQTIVNYRGFFDIIKGYRPVLGCNCNPSCLDRINKLQEKLVGEMKNAPFWCPKCNSEVCFVRMASYNVAVYQCLNLECRNVMYLK